MFSASTRILHTESFRISAIFIAIFALAALVLGVSTIYIVDEQFRSQIVQYAERDIAMVRDGYRTEGIPEAAEVIGQRLSAPGASDFFVLQRGSDGKIIGNLDAMTPRIGVQTLPYPGLSKPHEILGVGAFIAPGLYVFSGSDLFQVRQARQRLLHTVIWVLAGGLLLAGLAGIFVGRRFLRRIDAITATCRAIMDGNLTRRIAVRGTQDELDRLSENINRMLDRIAGLMENLRQVTNDVAHDLRTPLTHLRHRLERARMQARTQEAYNRALEDAIMASDEILGLFTALLRIAQIEGGSRREGFAPVDLADVLQHLKDVFDPVAEDSGHALILDIRDGVAVRGDPELLTQLFSNLIENAIVHTPSGTSVVLGLEMAGGRARAAVRDDGPGVPREEHTKLFRRLYRSEASRSKPGFGLGLALVAAIAELHDAEVTTGYEDGFSVTVLFPSAAA